MTPRQYSLRLRADILEIMEELPAASKDPDEDFELWGLLTRTLHCNYAFTRRWPTTDVEVPKPINN